ncbi:hypothetical protein BX666DRAFT_1837900, partial [Dichotomocladium elegans]
AFLRPSDLHRISLADSQLDDHGRLRLVIVAPKETRRGRRIIKDSLIAPLPDDESLCPVQAFNALLNHP